MPKSLLEQLPDIVAQGRKEAEKILESIESRHRVSLQTREVVLPAKDSAALDWVNALGLDAIAAHEHALLDYATAQLSTIPGLKIMGTARDKAALVAFTMQGAHPHDIGTILDREGVAIRAGHHCAQPVMQRYGVPATARASFAVYNTRDEVDVLVAALWKVKEMFEL